MCNNILRHNELPPVNSERWLSRDPLEGEIWLPVQRYEGLYEVSNYGRVYSLEKIVRSKAGSTQTKKAKMLHWVNKRGYAGVQMSRDGRHRLMSVHILVGRAFVQNPDNYPQINHKDENKLNNCSNNLEWCTSKYNNNYGTKRERGRVSQLNHVKKSRPVLQFTLDDCFVAEYPSAAEASRVLGLSKGFIRNVCKKRNHYKTAGGYKLMYKDECEQYLI